MKPWSVFLARFVCLTAILLSVQSASAQFWTREFNTTGEQLNHHYEAYMYLTGAGDAAALDFAGNVEIDDFDEFEFVNTGQVGSGRYQAPDWPEDEPFIGGDDYAMEARAVVTIPPGRWHIGYGTDDGAQLTLQTQSGTPIAFQGRWDEDPGEAAGEAVNAVRQRGAPSNQIWYDGNRGHEWSGSTFTVTEPTTAIFHASFHERGGGDNWEVAISDGSDGGAPNLNVNEGNGWSLLTDGVMGWGVTATEDLPEMAGNGMPKGPGGASLGIPRDGIQQAIVPTAGVVFNTVGDSTDAPETGGLWQVWGDAGNAGNLIGNLNALAAAPKESARDSNWAGDSGPTPEGTQNYPQFIHDSPTFGGDAADGNIESYIAWSSGEINLPEGITRFRLGVDDYEYMAVDTGGNGVAGDQPGEVLLDDNTWVNEWASRGDTNSSLVTGVEIPAGEGGWKAIEILMAEGGGGDSQMLYWNQGNEDDFPTHHGVG